MIAKLIVHWKGASIVISNVVTFMENHWSNSSSGSIVVLGHGREVAFIQCPECGSF